MGNTKLLQLVLLVVVISSVSLASQSFALSYDTGVKLFPSQANPVDLGGHSVSVSGNTLVMGAPDAGAAYVFERTVGSGNVWTESKRLLGPSSFGTSVSISGDTLVVASPLSGSVFIYERSTGWASPQIISLVGANSVSLSGDTLAIGDTGNFVRLYEKGTPWTPLDPIPPRAGSTNFGHAVSLDSDSVLIGAPGDAAFVYVRGTPWAFEDELTLLASTEFFGHTVGISGDTAVVGGPDFDTYLVNVGDVRLANAITKLFADGSTVLPGDSDVGDALVAFASNERHDGADGIFDVDETIYLASGSTVSVGDVRLANAITKLFADGSTVLPGDSDVGDALVAFASNERHDGADGIFDVDETVYLTNSSTVSEGDAYVFQRSAGVWGSEFALPDSSGQAASISGDGVVTGSAFTDTFFLNLRDHPSAANWGKFIQIEHPDGASSDNGFGFSVHNSGPAIVIGAIFDDGVDSNDDPILESGAAHVFLRDLDMDGVPDLDDNCPTVSNPQQLDTDGDNNGDSCDDDRDNDGVPNASDDNPLDPDVCEDSDQDTCDDCAIGTDDFGSQPDNDPNNDGLDTDNDGVCDAGDLCQGDDAFGDADLDGFCADLDCNDGAPDTHPGATDVPGNDADENCSGFVACYNDLDNDGFGDQTSAESSHTATNGVANTTCDSSSADGWDDTNNDCNDGNSSINPGATEVCDGLDNDCDGELDNNPIDAGGACSAGIGQCLSDGTEVCVAGVLSCDAVPGQPSAEVCNGQDNDCDGTVDNDNPGGGLVCDTGIPGVCSAGITECTAGALVCNQDETPSAEVCDGLDNDCDGTANNGFDEGDTCEVGIGECINTGEKACKADASGTECNASPLPPSAETCDGLDNNCDGTADDGNPGGDLFCDTGLLGVCSAGTTACTNGDIACNQDTQSSAETCDGLDNNCDGTADDGNPGGDLFCDTGLLGVCAAGTTSCTGGAVACNQDTQSSAETCDGLDNDCDGTADDGNPGGDLFCDTGLLGVCSAGTTSCTGGAIACNQDTQSSAEVCGDTLDNDCDGVIDNGCNIDPICDDAEPSESSIWPANHKFVDISISGVTDPDGDPTTILVTSIFQDEPLNAKGNGDGNTSPDGDGVGTDTAQVRAERSGTGDGRVYVISFTADDGQGGTCSGSVEVGVPHDKKDTAVNSGATIDSTQP